MNIVDIKDASAVTDILQLKEFWACWLRNIVMHLIPRESGFETIEMEESAEEEGT